MQIEDLIIYIDSSIIIVNKPSGLRTIPDGYQKNFPNLQALLKENFSSIFTVHRLDKETSGLIIFGRNKVSHRNLNTQFEQKLIRKTYHAMVHNIPEWAVYTINQPLLIDGDRKHRTVINPKGKSATTFLKKVEANYDNQLSLLEVHPKTGYTHQIRTHLNHLGFPILGDQLYSLNLSSIQNHINTSVERMMLHATSIEFYHPENNQRLSFQSDIPFSINLI